MATLVDPGRVGLGKAFTDQYGGNPSSVIYGQPLVSHQTPAGWWQYAAWYAPDNTLTLARRNPAGTWEIITLPIALQVDDSHNCIVLGVSTADGRLHVCAGQHADPMFYTRSAEGAVDDEPAWDADLFEPVTSTLAGTVVGELTYPTFTATPSGGLLFWYRNGHSGNGVMRAAEYEAGAWTLLGGVTSATGNWAAPNDAVSPTRNFYWTHPIYDGNGVLHLAGTWREANTAVLCSPGMITNHHVVYVTSPDHGRTWHNGAGVQVATTGADPIGVDDPGIHLPSFTNTNLAHQVSDLAFGPGGLVGILPDYVDPSLLTGSPKCVTTMDERFTKAGQGPRWLLNGVWDAEMIRVGGTIVRTGYPTGRKASTRGRLAFAPDGDMVVIFSGLRICSASIATGYTDWTVDEDGANTAYATGEIGGVDRSRESEGLLSVLYMQRDGRICVRDILLGA
jgi:hypothetical protein